ncbi:hypothetical protein [Cryobacterium sp. Y57]|uniref:hypothetical protein n=1 Tax=Cryobacterium sp. Y57 TaxID=2048287 RepID=UPI001E5D60BB|nr:hypothetical protein [Cryobacterium sp. Y57]
MTRIPAFVVRSRIVAATIVVGLIGLALWAVEATAAVRWLFSGYGLVIALIELVGMLRRLRRGSFGIDLLAIIAIVATILVGEYVATVLIVLMLAGGAALEDFAAGRAARELDALLKRAPQIAHRLDPDSGEATDVPATEVCVGDLLLRARRVHGRHESSRPQRHHREGCRGARSTLPRQNCRLR